MREHGVERFKPPMPTPTAASTSPSADRDAEAGEEVLDRRCGQRRQGHRDGSSRFTAGKRRYPACAGQRDFGYGVAPQPQPGPGTRHAVRADRDRGLSVLPGRLRGDLAAVADRPEIRQIDRYLAHAARDGLRIRYVVDTHTHADHFSAAQQLRRRRSACRSSCTATAPRRTRTCGSTTATSSRSAICGSPRCTRPGHTATPCACGSRTGLHRRHPADRRHRADRSAHRRSRGAVRQPVPASSGSIRRSRSTRRTTTRAAARRRSAARSPTIRGCRGATARPSAG